MMMRRPNPRVKDLVLKLKAEVERSNHQILRNEMNLEGVKRKLKNRKLDDRINKATLRYLEDGNISKFLSKMSYVLKLE